MPVSIILISPCMFPVEPRCTAGGRALKTSMRVTKELPAEVCNVPGEDKAAAGDEDDWDWDFLGTSKPSSGPGKMPVKRGTERSSETTAEQSSRKELPPRQTPLRTVAPVQRRKTSMFEDAEGDDLLDVLRRGKGPKKEEELRPARSTLDDLFGRGSAAKVLEKPGTGEHREFKVDKNSQKQAEEEERGDKKELVFGEYKPSMGSRPAVQPAMGQLVRRNPVRRRRAGDDWLGWEDEDFMDPASQLGAAEEAAPKPDPMDWLIDALARRRAEEQAKAQETKAEPTETQEKKAKPSETEEKKAEPSEAQEKKNEPSEAQDTTAEPSETAGEGPGPRSPGSQLAASPAASDCQAELLSAQARVAELESQVRVLEEERTQQKVLLESAQRQHQEHLDVQESSHRESVEELRKKHEEQLQHIKWLKEREMDVLTGTITHMRSLDSILERMEKFSSDLQNVCRRSMEEEQSRVQELVANTQARLGEQTWLLEQERAELKIQRQELKAKEEQLARDRQRLDEAWQEMRLEKEKVIGAVQPVQKQQEMIRSTKETAQQRLSTAHQRRWSEQPREELPDRPVTPLTAAQDLGAPTEGLSSTLALIPLDEVRAEWEKSSGPFHKQRVAEHCGVFRDLFRGATFTPWVTLRVEYSQEDEHVVPVYYGNMVTPSEASSPPAVSYEADKGSLWTLLLTNPGYASQERFKWLPAEVCNVPGEDKAAAGDKDDWDWDFLGTSKPSSGPGKMPVKRGTERSSETTAEQSSRKELPPRQTPLRTVAPVQRRKTLMFEDAEDDDLLDVLRRGKGPKKEEELRPARSTLDDLFGRGSAAKVLEKPGTGEHREFKVDKKSQKQAEEEERGDKKELVFGEYKPSMGSRPAVQPAMGQLVRRNPVRRRRAGDDWLGWEDEDFMDPASQLGAAEEAAPKPDPMDWLIDALARRRAEEQAKAQETKAEPTETQEKKAKPSETEEKKAEPSEAQEKKNEPSEAQDTTAEPSETAGEGPGPRSPGSQLAASPAASDCRAELLSAQARVAELESQVRMLEEERTQQKVLLESAQRQHQEHLDVQESSHRESVEELRKKHEEQLQHIKWLKEREMDVLTGTITHMRSLDSILERMEKFSSDLQNVCRRSMEEEQSRVQELVANTQARLGEQTWLLEQERAELKIQRQELKAKEEQLARDRQRLDEAWQEMRLEKEKVIGAVQPVQKQQEMIRSTKEGDKELETQRIFLENLKKLRYNISRLSTTPPSSSRSVDDTIEYTHALIGALRKASPPVQVVNLSSILRPPITFKTL
ncbi:hypothetical protein Q9966_006295 [Columba livia]|nr:hypothetical protein Q9966_006295 [Columba livia]